ncbi:hemerythrin domain-containing protein [Kitasatospora sp. NPDC059571]|uniref:hemerythrin domain-containing protein n=1 Tax=Kitasatospora sp. NPDC059571 TaxID=3346871 RepID=UPI00368637DE
MTSNIAAEAAPHPYTREMAMIHRIFRRESRLMPELVAKVPVGDTARATVLAQAWRTYALGLHVHHQGEDELLWPAVTAHLDPDDAQVRAMAEQHRELAETLTRTAPLMDCWADGALAEDRDALIAALEEHRRVLCAHLDAEETTVMPLVAAHVSEAQWRAVGERGLADTPRNRLMVALGAILEDATAEERAEFLGRLPLPGRILWRLVGQRQYRREMFRIRGHHRLP